MSIDVTQRARIFNININNTNDFNFFFYIPAKLVLWKNNCHFMIFKGKASLFVKNKSCTIHELHKIFKETIKRNSKSVITKIRLKESKNNLIYNSVDVNF